MKGPSYNQLWTPEEKLQDFLTESLERFTVPCICSAGFEKKYRRQVLKNPTLTVAMWWATTCFLSGGITHLQGLLGRPRFFDLDTPCILNEIWFCSLFKGFLKLQTSLHLDFISFIFSKIIQRKKEAQRTKPSSVRTAWQDKHCK